MSTDSWFEKRTDLPTWRGREWPGRGGSARMWKDHAGRPAHPSTQERADWGRAARWVCAGRLSGRDDRFSTRRWCVHRLQLHWLMYHKGIHTAIGNRVHTMKQIVCRQNPKNTSNDRVFPIHFTASADNQCITNIRWQVITRRPKLWTGTFQFSLLLS